MNHSKIIISIFLILFFCGTVYSAELEQGLETCADLSTQDKKINCTIDLADQGLLNESICLSLEKQGLEKQECFDFVATMKIAACSRKENTTPVGCFIREIQKGKISENYCSKLGRENQRTLCELAFEQKIFDYQFNRNFPFIVSLLVFVIVLGLGIFYFKKKNKKTKNQKAQSSIEYLIILGGAMSVALIVLGMLISVVEDTGNTTTQNTSYLFDLIESRAPYNYNPDEPPINNLSNHPKIAWSGGTRENEDFIYLQELNIKKAETNANWGSIETQKENYNFSDLHQTVSGLKVAGVTEICLAIYPDNDLYIDVIQSGKTIPQNPYQWSSYKNFLNALVNEFKDDVSCYQPVREINPARFVGTAKDYADFLVFSVDAIRQIQPNAKITFGALPYELIVGSTDRKQFLHEVIGYLPSNYFDFVDIHLHRLDAQYGGPLTKDNGAQTAGLAVDYFVEQLKGTIYEGTPITFETSAYTADAGELPGLPIQNEEDQAQDIQSRLEVLAQKGISSINLEGGIMQRKYVMFGVGGGNPISNTALAYFEHTGLIWSSSINEGKTGKKEAFDTVKEWNNS